MLASLTAPCAHLLLLKPLPLQITAAAEEEDLYSIGLRLVEVEKLYLDENLQFDMLFSFPEQLAPYQTIGVCLESELANDPVEFKRNYAI